MAAHATSASRVHDHHHQSLNRKDRWSTTDKFATSFLHFSLFSTALLDLPNTRPVHSLLLSSHLFVCPPTMCDDTNTHKYTCAHAHTHTQTRTHAHTTHTCTRTRTHTHTHTHMHARTYARTHPSQGLTRCACQKSPLHKIACREKGESLAQNIDDCDVHHSTPTHPRPLRTRHPLSS